MIRIWKAISDIGFGNHFYDTTASVIKLFVSLFRKHISYSGIMYWGILPNLASKLNIT